MLSSAVPVQCASSRQSSSGPVQRTPLYEVHKEFGGKFIEFFGWEMPVLYEPTGVLKEVQACREGAAIFDVSHMAQLRLHGTKEDRHGFVERVTVADLESAPNRGLKYTIVPNEKGGCVDDAIVTKLPDHIHMIVNSACFTKDMAHFGKYLSDYPSLQIENLYKSHALIALQGPAAEETMKRFLSDEDAEELEKLPFMTRMTTTVGGIDNVTISRCGYTGEDGFEISVPIKHAANFCRELAHQPRVFMAGLGSRDTLRLEAALSLYGQDLSADISLVEAGLNWTVTKRRKREGGFVGAAEILRQMKQGVSKKRIGLIVAGAPAREHATIHDASGKEVGMVTSGGPSPTIGKNIALGLVKTANAKIGGQLLVNVRGKMQKAQVVAPNPFFPHRYKKQGSLVAAVVSMKERILPPNDEA